MNQVKDAVSTATAQAAEAEAVVDASAAHAAPRGARGNEDRQEMIVARMRAARLGRALPIEEGLGIARLDRHREPVVEALCPAGRATAVAREIAEVVHGTAAREDENIFLPERRQRSTALLRVRV